MPVRPEPGKRNPESRLYSAELTPKLSVKAGAFKAVAAPDERAGDDPGHGDRQVPDAVIVAAHPAAHRGAAEREAIALLVDRAALGCSRCPELAPRSPAPSRSPREINVG